MCADPETRHEDQWRGVVEIIRMTRSCAIGEWAQEKRIGDMRSLRYQQIVDIVASNETSVHTVNVPIVRGSCHGQDAPAVQLPHRTRTPPLDAVQKSAPQT